MAKGSEPGAKRDPKVIAKEEENAHKKQKARLEAAMGPYKPRKDEAAAEQGA